MDNELKSLDAVEREIRARYNGKYADVSGYQASERATRKAITDIFRAVASCPAIVPGHMYIDKLIKIFYDFMIYTL